jgi:hypothetical protein
LDVFCPSYIEEMGVQGCVALQGCMAVQGCVAVHQLFIDFQEGNDSEEEYATAFSLGVLYLHMELFYMYNIALGPVNILTSNIFPAQSGRKDV